MKKLLIILFVCISATIANSQNVNVQSAFASLRNGYLDKARTAIDKAVLHEDTKNDPKAWMYKGKIYLALQITENPKYKVLVESPLDTAYIAFNKSKELDAEKIHSEDIKGGLISCSIELYNKGVSKYQAKDYLGAFDCFDKSAKIRYSYGMTDNEYSLALYNGALAAENSKSKDYESKAKENFKKLYTLKYKQAYVYSSNANYAKADGDTAKALKIIQQGREVMPDELDLVIAEANIYLQQKKSKEAQEVLKIAIQKDPKNPMLYMAVAQKYDESGNFADAEANYLKAIELKADYFDAVYNLGALYFNNALEILKAADKLEMGDPKYDTEKLRAEEMFKKSIPALEKAETLDPKDKSTLISLKQLYVRTKNTEGLKRINEKLGVK